MSESSLWDRVDWGLFGKLAGVVIAVSVVTILLAEVSSDSPDYRMSAVWPDRMSQSTPARVAVALQPYTYYDREVTRAEVTLFRAKDAVFSSGSYGSGKSVADDIVEGDMEQVDSATWEGSPVIVEAPASSLAERDASSDEQAWADLVLRVDDGEETHYWHKRLPLQESVSGALMLDRPLYQPGQTMKMRLVTVDRDTAQPVQTPITWEVKDPQGNLVYREEAETSRSGVHATDFRLADDGLQGNYRVIVTAGGRTFERVAKVQPYRLPRFEVEVNPSTTVVPPGGSIGGDVVATYMHGAPVKDAVVAVDVEMSGGISTTFSGRTNSKGAFGFDWELPPGVSGGSVSTISAKVVTDAGRAERGTARVRISGGQPTIEILPAARARFVREKPNHGYVIITAPGGTPVEGAEITLILPGEESERTEELVSDSSGRARFEWTPPGTQRTITVEVTMPGGETIRRNVAAEVVSASVQFAPSTPFATVGEPYEFWLNSKTEMQVVAVRDGYPVAAKEVEAKPQGGYAAFVFPKSARGLTNLVAIGRDGNKSSFPVWVRQQGPTAVAADVSDGPHRPGAEASLALSFPPSVGDATPEGDYPPVTFGLVGVDEALYALQERSGLPFPLLLREAPGALSDFADVFAEVEGQDEADLDIATHRFHRRLQQRHNRWNQQGNPVQITRHVEDRELQPYRYAWGGLLLLTLPFLLIVALRSTWRGFSREYFSWKRLFAQLGVSLLVGAVALGFVAMDEAFFAGGIAVAIMVIIGFVAGVAWRHRQLGIDRWILASLGFALLAGCMWYMLSLTPLESDIDDVFPIVIALIPGVLFVIEALIWSFVLFERREYHGALSLGVLFVGILGIPLAGLFVMQGGAKQANKVMANIDGVAPPPSSVALEEVASDAPAPARGKKERGPTTEGTAVSGGGAPRVRSWFPETMVWRPEILSDSEGRASLDIELPDSITTWRLDAYAHTWDGRVGQTRVPLVVDKPFFVQLDLPTHLTDGDRIEVPVTLVNGGDGKRSAAVTVEAGGSLTYAGGLPSSVFVAPGERRVVFARVRASGPGEGSLTISAATDGDERGDAVRRTVTVEPDGRTLREPVSGIVRDGWDASLDVPRAAIPGTTSASIYAYPSIVSQALDGLSGMLRRPTGCFEQTSSANYPNVLVLQTLEKVEPADWPDGEEEWVEARERATELIQIGYQRMLTFQKSSGGFALYPRRPKADIMLTAYGIMQLEQMSKVYEIDEEVVRRAAQFLVNQQASDGSWKPGNSYAGSRNLRGEDVGRVQTTAFAVLALTSKSVQGRYDAQVRRGVDKINERVQDVDSPSALAYAANALLAADRREDAKAVLNRLAGISNRRNNAVYFGADHPTWLGGRGVHADVETTAVAAYAFIESETHADLLGGALEFLAENRSWMGGWGTTQATAWTLRAFNRLRQEEPERVVLEITAGDEPVPYANRRGTPGEVVIEGRAAPLQHLRMPDVGPGARVVEVKPNETTNTMVKLVTEYAVPWDAPQANVDGERIEAELELEKRGLVFGVSTRAALSLRNPRNTYLQTVIAEAPLPPGAYVDRDALDDLMSRGVVDRYEVLPTHVRFYVSGLRGEQRLVLPYHFTPFVRGEMSLPPARAYLFYAPDPVTEIDSGDVRAR